MNREPGFYWVRWTQFMDLPNQWKIVEFTESGWLLWGYERPLPDNAFYEIDETQIKREHGIPN